MIARSKRFLELKERLEVLRHHFLPTVFSPTGSYDDKTLDHARGFILLVHAEIEAYFEDRAREKVDRAHKRWKSKQQCTELLFSLLTYHLARSAKGEGWTPGLPSNDLINKAVNFYLGELGNNHGIKEKNILSILIPLGLDHRRISTTLMGTLDSFGGMRGRLAHLSIKASQSLDPQTAWKDVSINIMRDLKTLDRYISKLR
jgi:hypothetical protein